MYFGKLGQRFLCVLLSALCAFAAIHAGFTGSAEEASNRYEEGILSYLTGSSSAESVQAWLDGPEEELFKHPVEWYFLPLYQSGKYDFTCFASAYKSRIPTADSKMANSTWLNRMMTAWVLGADVPAEEIKAHIVPGDIMSLVYGLHFANNTGVLYFSPSEFFKLQCEDGGFSLRGDVGDVDVTAMTLQALTPLVTGQSRLSLSEEEKKSIAETVERATAYLARAQLDNGGFQSFGADNCESVCQVIIALCGLGIDPATDSRFQKNGENPLTTLRRFRTADGAFIHKEGDAPADITAAETLCALAACERMINGQPSLYMLTRSMLMKFESEELTPTPEVPTPTEAQKSEAKTEAKNSIPRYRFYVTGAVIVLLLIALAVLKGLKRFTKKNVLLSVGIAAVLLIITWFTRFESVEKHYSGTEKTDPIGEVTITIRCDTIAGEQGAPADPVILPITGVQIEKGETAFAVLEQITKENRIPMDFTGSGSSVYVKGIAGLYEFDFGNLSGWIYLINGEEMSIGCGAAEVSPGDRIEFLYTKMLGDDLRGTE
ncbi:MAG: DUF4430 domain-containing protein [Lachnospiraceae bacterium]|nr:DUF4430 domain-containing protein [Lachnospiraceae bacterium]